MDSSHSKILYAISLSCRPISSVSRHTISPIWDQWGPPPGPKTARDAPKNATFSLVALISDVSFSFIRVVKRYFRFSGLKGRIILGIYGFPVKLVRGFPLDKEQKAQVSQRVSEALHHRFSPSVPEELVKVKFEPGRSGSRLCPSSFVCFTLRASSFVGVFFFLIFFFVIVFFVVFLFLLLPPPSPVYQEQLVEEKNVPVLIEGRFVVEIHVGVVKDPTAFFKVLDDGRYHYREGSRILPLTNVCEVIGFRDREDRKEMERKLGIYSSEVRNWGQ